MTLAFEGAFVGDSILYIYDQTAGWLRGFVHAARERQKPLDISIGVYAAVGARVGVWRAREKKVDASLRQLIKQIRCVTVKQPFRQGVAQKIDSPATG